MVWGCFWLVFKSFVFRTGILSWASGVCCSFVGLWELGDN